MKIETMYTDDDFLVIDHTNGTYCLSFDEVADLLNARDIKRDGEDAPSKGFDIKDVAKGRDVRRLETELAEVKVTAKRAARDLNELSLKLDRETHRSHSFGKRIVALEHDVEMLFQLTKAQANKATPNDELCDWIEARMKETTNGEGSV